MQRREIARVANHSQRFTHKRFALYGLFYLVNHEVAFPKKSGHARAQSVVRSLGALCKECSDGQEVFEAV